MLPGDQTIFGTTYNYHQRVVTGMRQSSPSSCGTGRCGILLLIVVVLTLLLLLLSPAANALHGACVTGNYGPRTLEGPVMDTEPVDVSNSHESDFQQRLVSYDGTLYVVWLTEEEDPEVTEFLQMRALGLEGWNDKVVINNPVPGEGHFHGTDIRVAGYDMVVHDGLLWFVWSTPSPEQTDGTDGDIVVRSFDGEAWGPIVEISPAGDEAIDITPAMASSGDRLVVVWATSTQAGRRIVTMSMAGGNWGEMVPITALEDGGDDFNPRVASTPEGAFFAWHHRDPTSEEPSQVTVQARVEDAGGFGLAFPISDALGYEDLWVDLRWHDDAMMIVWQRGGGSSGFDRSNIMYREWTPDGMGPEADISGAADGGFNGRPRVALTDEGPRIYWHTTDDGVSLGTSPDLVWRGMNADGAWEPVQVFRGDLSQDMVRIKLAEHGNELWATWMANVTHIEPPDFEPEQAWDVFVGPAHLGKTIYEGSNVWLQWENCENEDERTRVVLQGSEGPLAGVSLEVRVHDTSGNEEVLVSGVTDTDGAMEFQHNYGQRGSYNVNVVLEDGTSTIMPVEVRSVPEHSSIDPSFVAVVAIAMFLVVAALVLVVVKRR
jgi:hypothetical protein